ncbi:hypothetical protein Hanom_Chr11g00984321 [Helianthus anomalus]
MSSYTSADSDDLKQRFIKQVEDQVYEDMAILQELKRCFNGLHLGLFTRDHVSGNMMAMPSTSVRDLCVISNIECSDRDVEFMAMLKDIHREVQYLMEVKLNFLILTIRFLNFLVLLLDFKVSLFGTRSNC